MNKESIKKSKPLDEMSGSMVLLWALGLAAFLVNADNRAVAPVLPAIANDLHIKEATAGLLISAYSIPYGLFQLAYGPIADRIGKLRTISTALILFCLGTIGCGLVANFSSLFILRIITGIFAAGIIPISLAQIGDSFPIRERPKTISLFMSFSTSGQALGIIIGALVSQYYSWKWLFLLIGLMAIPAFLLFGRQKNGPSHAAATNTIPLKQRYRQILANIMARYVYLLIFLEGSLFFGGFTFLSVYANSSLKLNYLFVGLLASLYSLSALLGSRLITRAIAKAGQKNMPFLGAMIMAAAFFLIWLGHSAWALAAGFIMLGIGFSFCHSTLQTFATELLPEARGTAMSLFAFFLFIGSGIGPAVLGYVYDFGGAGMMLGVTALAFFLFSLFCRFVFRLPAFFVNNDEKTLDR